MRELLEYVLIHLKGWRAHAATELQHREANSRMAHRFARLPSGSERIPVSCILSFLQPHSDTSLISASDRRSSTCILFEVRKETNGQRILCGNDRLGSAWAGARHRGD